MTGAVLLAAHGSHLHADSSEPAHAHARRLRESGRYAEVRVAFWKEEPSLARALDGFEAGDVTVVPVFMSNGYFVRQVVPREMRLTGPVTHVDGRVVRYTRALGDHPALARVVVERAREAGGSTDDALAVLGHGTRRDLGSAENILRQAEFVRQLGAFRETVAVFMDQDPNMREVFSLVSARRIVMVPHFISDGWHVGETIPDDMQIDHETVRADGRALLFAGAVGTHPLVSEVIAEMVAEAQTWKDSAK